MPDEKAEALAIRKRFDGDAEGLANYLTRICICSRSRLSGFPNS